MRACSECGDIVNHVEYRLNYQCDLCYHCYQRRLIRKNFRLPYKDISEKNSLPPRPKFLTQHDSNKFHHDHEDCEICNKLKEVYGERYKKILSLENKDTNSKKQIKILQRDFKEVVKDRDRLARELEDAYGCIDETRDKLDDVRESRDRLEAQLKEQDTCNVCQSSYIKKYNSVKEELDELRKKWQKAIESGEVVLRFS